VAALGAPDEDGTWRWRGREPRRARGLEATGGRAAEVADDLAEGAAHKVLYDMPPRLFVLAVRSELRHLQLTVKFHLFEFSILVASQRLELNLDLGVGRATSSRLEA